MTNDDTNERLTKLVYIKRWRTLVELPEKYADEIKAALAATDLLGDETYPTLAAPQPADSAPNDYSQHNAEIVRLHAEITRLRNENNELVKRCLAQGQCMTNDPKLIEIRESIEFQRKRFQDVRLNFKQIDLLLATLPHSAPMPLTQKDLADGALPEALREMATALSVESDQETCREAATEIERLRALSVLS